MLQYSVNPLWNGELIQPPDNSKAPVKEPNPFEFRSFYWYSVRIWHFNERISFARIEASSLNCYHTHDNKKRTLVLWILFVSRWGIIADVLTISLIMSDTVTITQKMKSHMTALASMISSKKYDQLICSSMSLNSFKYSTECISDCCTYYWNWIRFIWFLVITCCVVLDWRMLN